MNVRKVYRFLAAAALLAFAAAPGAIAADLTNVGFLDQAAIGALPQFAQANAQVARYKATLDPKFAAAMKSAKTPAQQQQVEGEFQQRFLDKQRELLGPLFARAQDAIAQESSKQNLAVVVDKRIVIYGGQNITKAVVDLINSPQAIPAPAATPPPSVIGFVDQSQIDQTPNVKQANDAFLKFAATARTQALAQMKTAKGPAAQQQIFQNYQKSLSAQQDKTLKPIADHVRSVMASVAQKKHLILVIDRSDIIYGGLDITQDVQNALK
jgi:Skp family chaperone for outer membrane proteins